MNDETIAWEDILKAVEGQSNFLESDHTLRHFRDLWIPELFRSDDPSTGPWDGSEAALLDTCEEMWRTNLSRWEPPEWPAEVTRALEELLARAKQEFHGSS